MKRFLIGLSLIFGLAVVILLNNSCAGITPTLIIETTPCSDVNVEGTWGRRT